MQNGLEQLKCIEFLSVSVYGHNVISKKEVWFGVTNSCIRDERECHVMGYDDVSGRCTSIHPRANIGLLWESFLSAFRAEHVWKALQHRYGWWMRRTSLELGVNPDFYSKENDNLLSQSSTCLNMQGDNAKNSSRMVFLQCHNGKLKIVLTKGYVWTVTEKVFLVYSSKTATTWNCNVNLGTSGLHKQVTLLHYCFALHVFPNDIY
jgi:hypothetical protein